MITPEELEIMIWDKTLPKSLRFEIHELTRTVRMSDENLETLWHQHFCDVQESESAGRMAACLKDLRDRYEGLGKYAPAQPAAAPQPETVKP